MFTIGYGADASADVLQRDRRRDAGPLLRRQAREHPRGVQGDLDVLLSAAAAMTRDAVAGLTFLGKLFVAVAGRRRCGYGAWYYFCGVVSGSRRRPTVRRRRRPQHPAPASPCPATPSTIGIAYGTEKQRWLEWAVAAVRQDARGQRHPGQPDPDGVARSRAGACCAATSASTSGRRPAPSTRTASSRTGSSSTARRRSCARRRWR